jgi:hypothetical protein
MPARLRGVCSSMNPQHYSTGKREKLEEKVKKQWKIALILHYSSFGYSGNWSLSIHSG